MTTEESNPQSNLDSVSVVGSVDASEEVTREDLLRELAAPSCIKKLPKITVSSRKGDVLDTVKKTYFIGTPQHQRSSVVDQPIEPEVSVPQGESSVTAIGDSWQPTETQEIPGPNDLSIPKVTKSEEPLAAETKQTTVEPIPTRESKVETVKPAVVEDNEVILSVSNTDPLLQEKAKIKKNDNFGVNIETEVSLGFNPYSNLCASLGFLVQGVHEEIRELEQGNYKFTMHIEKML